MFYNTPILTYLWILTNKKETKRKGKVQLIDATEIKTSLKKNLGEKNAQLSKDDRKKILDLYISFDKADEKKSKVFDNKEFGYWSVDILHPLRLCVELSDENLVNFKSEIKDIDFEKIILLLRKEIGSKIFYNYNKVIDKLVEFAEKSKIKLTDTRIKTFRNYFTTINEEAEPVKTKDGYEADKNLTDTEKVPLLFEGGINGFFENEVKPYFPDTWIDTKSIKKGYELSFTKYFYKPMILRDVNEIISEIENIENKCSGLFSSIIGDKNE
jgi:type I restriction enzyme M protein